MDNQKEQKLAEISQILKTYKDDNLELDPYILKYLSVDELDTILLRLYEKVSNTIEDNYDWLMQFKKDML